MNNVDIHPTEIKLLQKQRCLQLHFNNEQILTVSCAHLRKNSPSAEVRGHGGVGGKTPTDIDNVNIIGIEPVGNYAVRLIFDDGHDTGIYNWSLLYQLALS